MVTTAADPGRSPGVLSLREAVNLANVYAAAGRAADITFAAGLKGGTITLTQGVLELNGRPASGTATITVDGGRAITINGNAADGIIQVDGGVRALVTGLGITNGFSAGSGGGIDNLGTLTVQNSTLSGNVAQDGGAIANSGTLTVLDSTLSGNTAGTGGAISNTGMSTVRCSTLSANSATGSGGGIANNGALTLQNSIVAANTAGSANRDILGSITNDLGNNLLGTALAAGTPPRTDVFTDTPGLAALGHYGGYLQTMALLPGSLALGAGTTRNAPATDERGTGRRSYVVDIGAFESAGFAITIVAGAGTQSALPGQAFLHPLAVLVKAHNALEPVNGGVITFTVRPSSKGASATLTSATATISNGLATVSATANGTAGVYTVVASTGTSSTIFNLHNT